MPTPREKFQDLLKKLFQFDCADLDFGIYRIMNQKRAVIERFIEKDLMDGLAIEIGSGALKDEAAARREFDAVAAKIREELEESPGDAIDPGGNLIQYQTSRLGKQYLSLQERLCGARSAKELESDILNHLYTFFSRYYDEGDFMSLRRYSKRDKYAIPYNGEEVHLHWANADQYYIKTGENFTDYAYKHGGWTVQFKLRNASVEQNNVKGAKRFFVPRVADVVVDDAAHAITIPFEYRPLNTDEEIRYGSKKKGENGNGNGESKPAEEAGGKKKKGQEGILADAVIAIQPAVKKNADALAALLHEKRKDADGNPVSLLDHYLRVYTRANSSDFFIHKDLKGFLEWELDFYIKNEVLNLDDLEMGGETRAKSWFQMLRAIKGIGRKIITFVAQIENFQKRLFEKKKFVTEVHYCVTLDRVPEELYPEITKNKAQIEEWKRLFFIHEIERDTAQSEFSEPLKVDFLKGQPKLPINTINFSESFTDRMLEKMGDLSQSDPSLLVRGDNLHGLRLLKAAYVGKSRCVYVDPPFNTENDDFPYKDTYKHSSWMAMIKSRVEEARNYLSDDGIFFFHIGDDEAAHARLLLDTCLEERKNSVIVRRGIKNVQAQFTDIDRLSVGYDTIHTYTKKAGVRLPHLRQILESERPGKWDTFWRGTDRETMRYELFGQKPERGQWRWEETRGKAAKQNYEYFLRNIAKEKVIDEWYVENLQAGVDLDFVRLNDEDVVQYYVPPQGFKLISDSWLDIPSAGNLTDFPHEKSLDLLRRAISWCGKKKTIVLDFFGGSGSTGHAALTLGHAFILFESAAYFDSVLLPRFLRYAYSADWKEGKPRSRNTGLGIFIKYIGIESYEDALDNISFQPADDQKMLELDDYVLSYLLDFETKHSETLLNVAKLDSPFDYKLRRHGKDQPLSVDLPETFNYLIGLQVTSRTVHDNKGARYLVYRGKADGRETVILWRATRGWGKKEFEADLDFVTKHKLTEGAEDVFVNTDSFIEGARSLDPVFKRRMFNEE